MHSTKLYLNLILLNLAMANELVEKYSIALYKKVECCIVMCVQGIICKIALSIKYIHDDAVG